MSNDISMNDFLNEIDDSFKHINEGDLVTGTVLSVNNEGAIINLGVMYDGLIPKDQLCYEKEFNVEDVIKVGDEVSGIVLKYNDGDGHIIISKRKADEILVWDKIEDIYKKKSKIIVIVKDEVKGGVITELFGLRAFIPASQLSVNYVENLKDFVGKELQVQIIEFNKMDRKIVLSRRIIEEIDKKKIEQQLWSSIKVGELIKGRVSKLVKFGAFVDIGGIEGLIHLSDLSWKRVVNPQDIVSEGDQVQVYVISIDIDKKRLGLSLKDTIKDPWDNIKEVISIGEIIQGTITRFAKFGSFVELKEGVEGLVHINEISDENITKPEDKLKIGENVNVKVLEVDEINKRISLSIEDAMEVNREYKKYNDNSEVALADMLGKKLKGLKFE